MRKHQEGYVLIYVMVALVLLSLLGAVSCSIAVSNLEAQRSSIDRMCDEYAAEGVVEQTRATLNGYTYSGEESTYYNTADAAQENATANFRATLDGIANSLKENPADTTEASPLKGNWNDATISWSKVSDNECTGTVELTLTTDQPDSTVAVETTVELTLTLELTAKYNSTTVNESENPDPKFLGYTYTVTVGSPKYTSFTHTTVDANESENQASTEPQTSDAKISVSANASGDAVCEASGSIYLTVGES